MFSEIVELISIVKTTNEIGDSIKTKTKRQVFCKEMSVGQNEFYQAQTAGFKPTLKLELYIFEYNNEQLVEYQGREYSVLRTYKKNSERIELTCEGVVNDGIA